MNPQDILIRYPRTDENLQQVAAWLAEHYPDEEPTDVLFQLVMQRITGMPG